MTVCDEIFVFRCSSEGAKVFWRCTAAGGRVLSDIVVVGVICRRRRFL